jgi:cytochrome c oxidase subunit I+III
MVSMIVPAMTRTPLVAHRLVVLALVGTGFLSFGLWVHHMFATGIPKMSLGFFSAASMAVAVPSAIQVFAWIATLAAGRLRLTVPALFILGFLFIFVLGGLTGVMVAMVPFDLQAHDSYFVVAHLHYVLFGGMVFPLFAALYYWLPMLSRRRLSERAGRFVFALMFVGFNVAFLPMHLTGLAGMPRRVYTYGAGLGFDTLNLISTIGAFLLAVGIAVFVIDFARSFRFSAEHPAGNVWAAGTLEWLPSGNFGVRSVPAVASREPLWERPGLSREVQDGAWYLPGSVTGARETLVSSALDATPQHLLQIPGPSWRPLAAAVFTAAFFLLLTAKLVVIASVCGIAAIVFMAAWAWQTDPGVQPKPVDVGGGLILPVNAQGPQAHSWWAMVVLLIVAASIDGALVFSYAYLWLVSPHAWPAAAALAPGHIAGIALALLALGAIALLYARRVLSRVGVARWRIGAAIVVATGALAAASGVDLAGQLAAGVSPSESSYGAAVIGLVALQALYVVFVAAVALFALARLASGRLDRARCAALDTLVLLGCYTAAQGAIGVAVVHAFPRLVA